MWKEGRAMEIVDSKLVESCEILEAMRCINVSLLCVQKNVEDRPNMGNVILMLGSEISLPQPKEPAFFCKDNSASQTLSDQSLSSNNMSFSLLNPR